MDLSHTQDLLRFLSPAELRELDGLLAGLGVSRSALLRFATDVELDQLDRSGVAPGELAAVLAACARRMAAGEPPWSESPAGLAAADLERSIYWNELLPRAREQGVRFSTDADFGLHEEARQLAAERIAVQAGTAPPAYIERTPT